MSPSITTTSAYHAYADTESSSSVMRSFKSIACGSDVTTRLYSSFANTEAASQPAILVHQLFRLESENGGETALGQKPLPTLAEEFPIYVPYKPIAVRRLIGRIVRRVQLGPNPILNEE